ncbi:DUF58 domain-containing protein [Nocardioides sp. zg-1308]|uniref:DUF58 domain-containing protein n=1 Tax=Nocardioides renjunii TaxID=3095075 RepID=A0ABU5KCQ3_9ACTN|nr:MULTISPECIES: DUF58 domain-containing protein [unclassified Nocardioides]MDZ5662729.1 DUF58 domain-containing protein [Nocardioides sp. S-58]NPD05604.1 DUF58 domain-containing protein [Nocardioides sp. zg-1308]WQQ23487.1 DUF58 domain-containing protein [Nocardioides sp. S-34]
MTPWRPTPSLVRSCLLALGGLAGGVVAGLDVLVVLAAPFVVLAAAGVLGRPRHLPRVASEIDHHRLHEGQGTASRLVVDDLTGVEHVTRVAAPAPHVATRPTYGASGALVADGLPVVELSPRRWGRRVIGAERVALTGPWAGWRWGPTDLPEHGLFVLPQTAPYDSRAEVPQPDGLVGRHRSRRLGSGTEFEGIRQFAAGDRLKRITWPVSLRTGELHVITTRAEQDAGVWLVVDGLRDIGASGGIDGEASSLDLTVRAAAALAEHHIRTGDRVGLLVVSSDRARVPLGSGPRHLHRLEGTLARIRTDARSKPPSRLDLGAGAGSVVHVLSPMLFTPLVTATAGLQRRGASVVVIDTLGDRTTGQDRLALPSLAARMQKIERDDRLRQLAALGCPVVPWRGPGTLDTVLHQLARRAQVPKVRSR